MQFTGPTIKECQTKRKVPQHASEHQKHDFLKHAGASAAHWEVERGGDGSSRFSPGFYRKRVDWAPAHAAADEKAAAAFYAHDARRSAALSANVSRNGFNPVTGQEDALSSRDTFKPRGRV
jgi:hypothetical protein